MASFVRCPRCGAFWADADVPMNSAFVCLDCITQPPAPAAAPRLALNRRAVFAVLGAAAVCALVYLALPTRTMPLPNTDPPEPVSARPDPEPLVSDPVPPSPDATLTSLPERPAEKPRSILDLPDEPLQLYPSLPVRVEKKEEKPAEVAKPTERRKTADERELLAGLAKTPEVGLGTTGPTVLTSYAASMQLNLTVVGDTMVTDPSPLISVRPDLRTLPIRGGAGSQLNPVEAANLSTLSRQLRVYLNTTATADGSPRPETAVQQLRAALLSERRGARPEWLRREAAPTLLQMLMAEEAPVRRLLVDLLAEVPHNSTTTALAQRAVFDLDDEVRQAAVAALKKRPAEVSRPVLLKALRYPWAPAADHAAVALVELGDKSVVPQLVKMLRQPDPALPETLPNGLKVIREVVRVNHTANCLMCHPPSPDGNSPVIGIDPVLNIPTSLRQVPVPPGAGLHNYGQRVTLPGGPAPLVLRGDVTFYRQDFSAKLETGRAAAPPNPILALPMPIQPAPAAAAPPSLRFDFMVRTRSVGKLEAARIAKAHPQQTTYPQREAVLYALRELTGKDAGPTTEAWRELFPRAELDAEADRMRRALKEGNRVQQGVLLARWREVPGDLHIDTLARLIPDLGAELQEKVRDILADCLSRGKADALRKRLGDEDVETRRAAVLACARKKDTSFVPDLIAVLEDAEPADAALIEEALQNLTGERQDGAGGWKAWWEKRSRAR
jgi:HEAT repeat protein